MEESHTSLVVKCADPDCAHTYTDHRWGHIKASAEGWFFPKHGAATCAAHNPPWVAEWRKTH